MQLRGHSTDFSFKEHDYRGIRAIIIDNYWGNNLVLTDLYGR